MRHLIRQLNEAAGRKYYVLAGWTADRRRWEVIFSDYDRGAVEFEQDDYKRGPNYGEEYKPIRILTVDNARRGTVDAAVAALDAPGGKAKTEAAEDPWEKAAGMIEQGDDVLKIFEADLDGLRRGLQDAKKTMANLRKGGVGVTESITLVVQFVLPPLYRLHKDAGLAVDEVEKLKAVKRNA